MLVKRGFSLKEFLIPYIATLIGCILAAVAITAFFVPHNLLSGGIGGINMILYYSIGLPMGIGMFLLNIPIMIACYKFMGRSYTILSIVGTIFLSIALDATAFLSDTTLVKDPIIHASQAAPSTASAWVSSISITATAAASTSSAPS